MFNRRLTRTAAIAVAIAATGAPAASAEPVESRLLPAYPPPAVDSSQDRRNPDTRDFAEGRGTYSVISPAQARDLRSPDTRDFADGRGTHTVASPDPTGDLRSPDTRDFADGRGTYNAPEVVVVKAPPLAEPTATGIDWEDVGIGAGGLLGASLIALGGALLVVHRRGARAQAAH